jgi:hypothetical protein
VSGYPSAPLLRGEGSLWGGQDLEVAGGVWRWPGARSGAAIAPAASGPGVLLVATPVGAVLGGASCVDLFPSRGVAAADQGRRGFLPLILVCWSVWRCEGGVGSDGG